MGHLGRITSLKDLPPDRALSALIRKAVALNEQGVQKPPRPRPAKARPVRVPRYLAAALDAHPRARETFEGFPPGHKREYIEWLTEAKTEETRQRRLETAIAWMEEGKPRNWKYMARKK